MFLGGNRVRHTQIMRGTTEKTKEDGSSNSGAWDHGTSDGLTNTFNKYKSVQLGMQGFNRAAHKPILPCSIACCSFLRHRSANISQTKMH